MASSASGWAPNPASISLALSARSRRESISVPSRSKTTSLLTGVRGEGGGRLPHGHTHRRKSLRHGIVEQQFRDMLHRRIALHDEDRLAKPLQRPKQRVVVTQNHLVIELPIHPALDDPLDIRKIAHHVA